MLYLHFDATRGPNKDDQGGLGREGGRGMGDRSAFLHAILAPTATAD